MTTLSKFFLNIVFIINDKLSKDFYPWVSSIILLYSAILTYNSIFTIESLSGVWIYAGLFTITSLSQVLEIFLLVVASIILISWSI
jgi:NADH-ubiquinone oxidoreductase chain 2